MRHATMRRSKSNPAKYARNYRSISQRRMTEYDNVDEEKEMERLRAILKNSEAPSQQQPTDDDKRSNDEASRDLSSLIQLQDEQKDEPTYGEDNTALLLAPKKKRVKTRKMPELTPQEIRQAKLLQKNSARKLKQLTERAQQKKKRTELYAKLQETAISSEEMQLLASSSTLGKRETKRETLKRLIQRERAGIALTAEEKSILYQNIDVNDDEYEKDNQIAPSESGVFNAAANNNDNDDDDGKGTEPADYAGSKKKRKKKRKRNKENKDGDSCDTGNKLSGSQDDKNDAMILQQDGGEVKRDETGSFSVSIPMAIDEEISGHSQATMKPENFAAPVNFAAQMMASLSTLKAKSDVKKEEQDNLAVKEAEKEEAERIEKEQQERSKQTRYLPSNPAVLKTAAALGLQSKDIGAGRKVLEVNRPTEIEAVRYDLPVSGMEFEIVDAIRNNDVTILCGETGSGKSTQVPQFLYEAGFSLSDNDEQDLLIGVTQPRRVAVVSTAKRVCHEMGYGDGRRIKGTSSSGGNLVAYQTRYETAGLGRDTRIKFMTDGILLKEIQSDLLLRRYGAIVLDEAHERNLNTDVLLGLLSVAVPLRKKAAIEEGSGLLPLKLVIMSATLRVEDFTGNSRLFSNTTPALVKVPGRTHPVTVHHSKITELDDYEAATFNKVCKIHRKLPKGGILVFLTGKQEILRMVKRLRRSLGGKKDPFDKRRIASHDVQLGSSEDRHLGTPRDLDDEEVDGDIFHEDTHDDFDDIESNSDEEAEEIDEIRRDPDDNIPKNVTVLPLYSMLSAEEQARVFEEVPEGTRLIVVATNIAETSITIPDITYVVDSGRQKCRNYHAGTGVASYDVMWISRAAADQRAGRAGRTGPGHCYRMYSSSMYSRYMNSFALPEVLTRPLEDVVLAMKAMNVSNVANFPFPTAPDQSQLDSAVKLLANIGCVDVSNTEQKGGDGEITALGAAVAKLPLGVRYGKMLLVAAQAGVMDYAIIMVAVQSESSPFHHGPREDTDPSKDDVIEVEEDLDEVDCNASAKQDDAKRKELSKSKWTHRGGDILAAVHAVGAYSYAGQGASGVAEKVACRTFCEENGLNHVVMERIQKMRLHLARLAKARLSSAEGIASKTGGILNTMPPPNRLQENLLLQAIASGLLDNVALLAPPGSITSSHPHSLRSAYLCCSATIKEPLFMDRNSVSYSRDWRRLPQWVCFDSIVRKETKTGDTVANMKNITPIDPSWLGPLAMGSRMISLGEPLPSPLPSYNVEKDVILCSVSTKFGSRGWEIPPVQVDMYGALQNPDVKKSGHFLLDDSFRWFARFLLEGKVLPELSGLAVLLNDEPSIITRKKPLKKVALIVSALSSAGVDNAGALRKHWAEVDDKFLFSNLKSWTKQEYKAEVKQIWIGAVKGNVKQWRNRRADEEAFRKQQQCM